jgi:hypothetical protein
MLVYIFGLNVQYAYNKTISVNLRWCFSVVFAWNAALALGANVNNTPEPVFVNVLGAQESIPGFLKRFTNFISWRTPPHCCQQRRNFLYVVGTQH